jgi:site-specific recombinase XerD
MPKLNHSEIIAKGLRMGTRTYQSGERYYAQITLRGSETNTCRAIVGSKGDNIYYENGSKKNRDRAKRYAYELQYQVNKRYQIDGTTKVTYLHKIAKEYLIIAKKQMEESETTKKPIKIDGGSGNWSNRHLSMTRLAIKKYIIPYFSKYHSRTPIDEITDGNIENFVSWRDKTARRKYKQNYTASTLNKHNNILRHLFKFAQRRKIVSNIPTIKSYSNDLARKREGLDKKELDLLIKLAEQEAREYENDLDIPSYKTLHIYRQYFLHFIRLLAMSGIRPNSNIKNKDIAYTEEGNLTIKRSEKNLPTRIAIFKNEFIPIHEEFIKFKEDMGISCKKNDWYFTHPNQVKNAQGRVKSFHRQWNRVVKSNKKLQGKVFYSLRHYYITKAIYDNIPINAIASQCGTSPEMISKTYFQELQITQADLFA